jgi:hypothetical protein
MEGQVLSTRMQQQWEGAVPLYPGAAWEAAVLGVGWYRGAVPDGHSVATGALCRGAALQQAGADSLLVVRRWPGDSGELHC